MGSQSHRKRRTPSPARTEAMWRAEVALKFLTTYAKADPSLYYELKALVFGHGGYEQWLKERNPGVNMAQWVMLSDPDSPLARKLKELDQCGVLKILTPEAKVTKRPNGPARGWEMITALAATGDPKVTEYVEALTRILHARRLDSIPEAAPAFHSWVQLIADLGPTWLAKREVERDEALKDEKKKDEEKDLWARWEMMTLPLENATEVGDINVALEDGGGDEWLFWLESRRETKKRLMALGAVNIDAQLDRIVSKHEAAGSFSIHGALLTSMFAGRHCGSKVGLRKRSPISSPPNARTGRALRRVRR